MCWRAEVWNARIERWWLSISTSNIFSSYDFNIPGICWYLHAELLAVVSSHCFSTNICVPEYKLFFLDTADDYNQSNLVTFILRLLWNDFSQFVRLVSFLATLFFCLFCYCVPIDIPDQACTKYTKQFDWIRCVFLPTADEVLSLLTVELEPMFQALQINF